MEKIIDLAVKWIIDLTCWAFGSWMLATAFGWPFGRVGLATAGVILLYNSCKPWGQAK